MMLVLAGAIMAAGCANSTATRSGRSASRPSRQRFWVQGKYEAPDLAVAAGGAGVAWLHGYTGNADRQIAWLDHKAGGSRTWTSGPSVDALSTSPQSADQFAFVGPTTLVGYGTTGLWISHDVGLSWREALPGWTVTSVAGDGSRLWVAAHRCGPNSTCASVLLHSRSALIRFKRVAHQPPLRQTQTLMRLSRHRLAVGGLASGGDAALAVTSNNGHTWLLRSLPCSKGIGHPELTAASSTIWLTCRTRATGPAPLDGLYATYRSVDGGRGWIDMTRQGRSVSNLSALPVSGRAAWGEQWSIDPTSLLRTVDAGRHWSPVPTPWRQDSTIYVALAPLSTNSAWCLTQTIAKRGTTFTVYRTADAGRRWIATPLPGPRNLPAGARVRRGSV